MTGAPPRLVVLGTGFGAFNLIKSLSDDYRITVVSPRNHFLFTPLLPSTTVGTIEFRSIIEPVRHAREGITFYHARAEAVDPAARVVRCVGVEDDEPFDVPYDRLVIAVGAISNTFGVPGVSEHATFLRELSDARMLRQRVIRCFERANLPRTSQQERSRLLHFVVCGGGPTGVEFAGELSDFLTDDLKKSYPHLVPEARITLVEALKEILTTFDEKLRRYATELFRRQRITILTDAPVRLVTEDHVELGDGTRLPYGLLLWSTGNGPTAFARTSSLPKDAKHRFIVDRTFRLRDADDIFAIGDCSVLEQSPLPATAQAAQQQGKHLARVLRALARGAEPPPFRYRHLGMLAYVGGNRALADLDSYKGRGWTTWLFWRSAYLTRLVSFKNKVLVLFDWVKARLFGRDISQF
jgi:NADH:ubiquinone reductase (non-electrogenic)